MIKNPFRRVGGGGGSIVLPRFARSEQGSRNITQIMIPSDYSIGINQQQSLQIELSEIYRPVPGSCHVLFTRVGGNCFHTETILSCTPSMKPISCSSIWWQFLPSSSLPHTPPPIQPDPLIFSLQRPRPCFDRWSRVEFRYHFHNGNRTLIKMYTLPRLQ